ncbi:porin [Thalassotalea crassostreae]|uniref:porin n=1 Tax=Thalassotalea crassostreae TaxID=1763536 RepID=UPI000837F0DC|nr:porin [Thalassotalea crassostreae]
MKIKHIASVSTVALGLTSFTSSAVEIYKDDKNLLTFGGDLSTHFVSGEDASGESYSEIKDGFSRINLNFTSQLSDGWSAIAKTEWKVRLTENDSDLVLSGNDKVAPGDSEETLANRLGYIGVTHDKWGSITMGKQWGSTYMVTGVTDSFMIFGADGLGIYDLGDGGYTGVGRAEKALQYNNTFGNLAFSTQIQAGNQNVDLTGSTAGDGELTLDNSYAVAAAYTFNDILTVGLGYNVASIEIDTDLNSGEYDDTTTAASVTYGTRGGDGLYVAVAGVKTENHQMDNQGGLLEEATGIETMVAYRFDNDFEVIGGLISTTSDESGNDYEKKYAIIGGAYYWSDNFTVYSEIKIDDSTYVNQDMSTFKPKDDVVGVGARFTF